MFELNDRGVENLCIGVVEQAAEDYLRAKENLYKLQTFIFKTRNGRCLGKDRQGRMAKHANEIWECLNFFRSDWFKQLTPTNPEYLISKLDEEFRSRIPLIILKAL